MLHYESGVCQAQNCFKSILLVSKSWFDVKTKLDHSQGIQIITCLNSHFTENLSKYLTVHNSDRGT